MNTNDLMILIIVFTCVGLFIATAIAVVLDLFNLLALEHNIRNKLHAVLVVEIVGIAVAAFAGYLNPYPMAQQLKRAGAVEGENVQLSKQLTDATKLIEKPKANELVVEFPWVDTASAPGHVVAAAPYLHGVGISVTALKPQQSEVVLLNNRIIYEGEAVVPTTSQNILTQISSDNIGPASFTLAFSDPCDSVSFTRPALFAATTSGVTHPAWTAHALDAQGGELSSQSEALIRSSSEVPARTYTLNAPGFDGIAAVRFDSDWSLDGKPFAGFRAILIERLTLERRHR